MNRYHYIPSAHEATLAAYLSVHYATDGAYCIITPVYVAGESGEGISPVFARDHLMQDTYFPYTVDSGIYEPEKIAGYIIEGEIETINPQAYQLLATLEGVVIFTDSQSMISHITTIKNELDQESI